MLLLNHAKKCKVFWYTVQILGIYQMIDLLKFSLITKTKDISMNVVAR